MSFDWKDYITLAEEISNRNEERFIRTSVSRAYYGVYWILRLYKEGGIAFVDEAGKKIGDHQAVINVYLDSHDKKEVNAGNALDRMRTHREYADYDRNASFSSWDAKKAIQSANHILSLLGL